MSSYGYKGKYRYKRESLLNNVAFEWGVVLLLALLLFGLTAAIMPITYTFIASDDRFLASYLAGYWSGVPESSLPFINPIFSKFVSTLYKLAPNIHWYPDLHVGTLFLSFVLITRSLFVVARNKKIHWAFPLIVSTAVYFCVFAYNVTWLSFTLTPALACAGAAAVILCGNFKNKYWYIDAILATVLIFMAYIWRSSSAQAGLCFCAGAAVYRIFRIWKHEEGKRMKAFIKLGLFAMIIAVLLGVSENAMKAHTNDPELADYYAFRKSCTQYLDYPGIINYEDDPELYESLGISQHLEQLAKHWFFMDDAITADAFNTLAGVKDPNKIESFLDTHLTPREALKTGRDLFLYDSSARWILCACLSAFLLGCVLFLKNIRRNWLEFFILCCFALGAFVLCFYLCLLGRFPIRTFGAVACSHLTVTALLCGRMYDGFQSKSSRVVRICYVVIVALIALSGIGSARNVFSSYERENKDLCIAQATAVETLAIENPDNIYIFDFLLAMCNVAYPDYSEGLPSNLFYWGGSYLGTEGFTRQMKLNGIDRFEADLLLQDNVYFVTYEDVGEINHLWPYMIEEWGAQSCEIVHRFVNDTVAVYRIS